MEKTKLREKPEGNFGDQICKAIFDIILKLRGAVFGTKPGKKLTSTVAENAYVVLFGMIFTMFYYETTMLYNPVIRNYSMGILSAVAMGFVWIKVFLFDLQKKEDILTVLLPELAALAVVQTAAGVGRYRDLVVIYILIIGARNVNFRKIAKTAVALSLVFLSVITVLSLLGLQRDMVDNVNGVARHSFGFNYSVHYAAHWFFTAAAYFWLRRGRLKWYETGAFVVLTAVVYYFCRAKVDCICLLLVTGAGVLLNFSPVRKAVVRLKWLWVLIFVLFAALSFVMCLTYTPSSPIRTFLEAHFHTLHSRFRIGYETLNKYGFTFFGNFIIEMGAVLSNGKIDVSNYNFIDNSYIKLFTRCGAIYFAGLMSGLTWFMYKRARAKDAATLVLMAVIALNTFIAFHMIDLGYNIFILMMFANLDAAVKPEKAPSLQPAGARTNEAPADDEAPAGEALSDEAPSDEAHDNEERK